MQALFNILTPELIVGILGAGVAVAAITIYAGRARALRIAVEQEREHLKHQADQQDATLDARERELKLQAKEEALRLRSQIEEELKQARREVENQKRRLDQREDALDRKKAELDVRERDVERGERQVQGQQAEIEQARVGLQAELERVSSMTPEQAREVLLCARRRRA